MAEIMTPQDGSPSVKPAKIRRRGFLGRSGPVIPGALRAVDSGFDSEGLKEKLSGVSAGDAGRTQALGLLKEALAAALKDTQELFERGRIGGLETARRISSVHTDLVSVIYDYARDVCGDDHSQVFSICAVGGFGRGEMAPGSDLDLLFLHTGSAPSETIGAITEFMLYMLWDMGLKVGQSCRSIEQNLKLAKEDQTILTSLLDCRYIAGDEDLAQELRFKFRIQINKGRGRGFIAAKLEERDVRHAREGNSRYVIEPNIKEGKGALRDLHVLYWIARYIDKDAQIVDPQRAEDYVAMGLFDEQAADRFVRAADFLWRTRCHLHYTSGRPTENLSFDFQTKLARKMGYAAGPVEVAVEKFMREYFTNAREVGAITRIACAKLEQASSLRLPQGLDRLLPTSRRGIKRAGFILDHGRLNFADDMKIKENPSLILELFQIAGSRNLDLHPDALGAIDFRRNLMDNSFRKDPKNAKIFLDTLLGSKAPGAVMKIMNEAGVLGRYLIEFGGIVARTQFNMHHAYTVDDHTIGLVRYYDDLEKGALEKENPVATKFVKGFTDSQRRILYMACLLHDTGKGVGDQCIEGARLSRRACRRMGMAADEIDTVSWLIRRHLDMSETAQRRDISDPETIAEFAENVGSPERLQMLMALTIVDIRAVGPGIWNDWKGTLLRELYHGTLDYLSDKPNIAPRSRANAARETLFERLPLTVSKTVETYMEALDDSYWLSFSVSDQVRHARFIDGAIDAGGDHHVQTRLNKAFDITELWIMTTDRAGLFADMTGAIASSGASITGARLHTGEDGSVFNIFYLQNQDGLAFARVSSHMLESLRLKTLKAIRGEGVDGLDSLSRPSRRARSIPVKTQVAFEDREAKDVVILTVQGRDRAGLLHEIAKVLNGNELVILSAHIEVIGATAVDVFYLKYLDGSDQWRAEKRITVEDQLLRVLDDKSQV